VKTTEKRNQRAQAATWRRVVAAAAWRNGSGKRARMKRRQTAIELRAAHAHCAPRSRISRAALASALLRTCASGISEAMAA